MDFLPIQPTSTNKVNSAINLANDGGSKSNSGYFSNRGEKENTEEPIIDEVILSTLPTSSENEEVDLNIKVKNFFELIKDFLKKTKEFILKLLGFNKIKIENIYKEKHSKTP